MTEYRVEHDSMGEVRVPVDALWGAQTQRAVENFPISGRPVDRRVIRALALIKSEAAKVNAGLSAVPHVDRRIANAIAAVADEVAEGAYHDEFPIDAFQTGSGTSTNMNVNEVLACLASARLGEAASVHPNDQVNASQSSNDVFPSAVHLAAARGGHRRSDPGGREARARAAQEAARVRARREGGPDAPHGRDAGHARPGVRRVRHAGRGRDRAPATTRCRDCACCRSAAPRSGPASTRRRASPAR